MGGSALGIPGGYPLCGVLTICIKKNSEQRLTYVPYLTIITSQGVMRRSKAMRGRDFVDYAENRCQAE